MQYVVERCLRQLGIDIEGLVAGNGQKSYHNFQSSFDKLSRQFCDLIYHVKPMINVAHPSDHADSSDVTYDDDDVVSIASMSGRRHENESGQQPKRVKLDVNDSPIPITGLRSATTPTGPNRTNRLIKANSFVNTPFEQYTSLGKGFMTLGEIEQRINQYNRPGLPGTINDRIYDDLALQAVACWREPCMTLLFEAMRLLRTELSHLLVRHLSQYQQTELYRKSVQLVEAKLDQLYNIQRAELEVLFELEARNAYTVNSTTFEEQKSRERTTLTEHRNGKRANSVVEREISRGIRKYRSHDPIERQAAKSKWICEISKATFGSAQYLGPDPAQVSLDVAIWLRAYVPTIETCHRTVTNKLEPAGTI